MKSEYLLNNIPHIFDGDVKDWTIKECLDWIKNAHQEPFPEGLFPIYGKVNDEACEGNASFLLIKPSTGELYEINGSHCSCYGFEGQFEPSYCPMEYLEKGKQWQDAYETVLKVKKYFETNPLN